MQTHLQNLVFPTLLTLLLVFGNAQLASAANTVLVIDAQVLRNSNWLAELTAQTDATISQDEKNSYAIIAHDDIVLYSSEWLPSLENWELPTSILRQTDNSNFSAGFEKALSMLSQAPPDSAGNDRISLLNNGRIKVNDESKQNRFEKWFKLILLPQANKSAITTHWISIDAQPDYYLSGLALQGMLDSKNLNLNVAETPTVIAEPAPQITLAQAPAPAPAPPSVAAQEAKLPAAQTQVTPTELSVAQASNEPVPSNLLSWLIPSLLGVAILLVGVFFYLRQASKDKPLGESLKTDPTLDDPGISNSLDATGEHVPSNLVDENAARTALPIPPTPQATDEAMGATTKNPPVPTPPVQPEPLASGDPLDATAENRPPSTSPVQTAPPVADKGMDVTAENPLPQGLDQTPEKPNPRE